MQVSDDGWWGMTIGAAVIIFVWIVIAVASDRTHVIPYEKESKMCVIEEWKITTCYPAPQTD